MPSSPKARDRHSSTRVGSGWDRSVACERARCRTVATGVTGGGKLLFVKENTKKTREQMKSIHFGVFFESEGAMVLKYFAYIYII